MSMPVTVGSRQWGRNVHLLGDVVDSLTEGLTVETTAETGWGTLWWRCSQKWLACGENGSTLAHRYVLKSVVGGFVDFTLDCCAVL